MVDVVEPYSNQRTPVGTEIIDAIGVFANLTFPHRSLKALSRLRDAGVAGSRERGEEKPAPHRFRRRLDESARRQIVAKYRQGATAKAIADSYGISKTALIALLRDAGVAIRRQPLSEDQLAHIVRRYEAGDSIYAIERATGIPKSSVGRALNVAGVNMRQRGGS